MLAVSSSSSSKHPYNSLMQGTKKDRSGDPARKFRPQGAIASGLHSITEGEKSPTSKKAASNSVQVGGCIPLGPLPTQIWPLADVERGSVKLTKIITEWFLSVCVQLHTDPEQRSCIISRTSYCTGCGVRS